MTRSFLLRGARQGLPVAWSCLALGLLTAAAAAADPPSSVLPLKRVVMFSSGVAFFERGGEVEGNATVDLKFNVRDVNDLLKSMVLQDLGGGRISTVSYGSKDPITRTLQTFAIDLTANPSLADLLRQVRGEAIEISAPNKIVGTIVGVETRQQPVGENKTISVDYLNVLTEEGLRSVPLNAVGSIKLSNPKLDAELRQALLILAQSHDTDKKTVTLSFLGQNKRSVRVGYIQEAPVWKTSYRLVLDDAQQPLLQGWAIVENTTEEDWNGLQLTLVSGRPISFVMDLYEPLFVNRPEVKPELYAAVRPRTYDQDLAKAEADFRRAAAPADEQLARQDRARAVEMERKAMAAAPAPPPAAPGYALPGRPANGAGGFDARQGFQAAAQAGEAGEMFQYTIATPVTVGRQKSAMLPIVNESVKAEKVSIYDPATHAKHPLNGLKLTNSTELHLMQGPITVYDGGAYAGDAQIQDLPSGSERLISYALDLDTEVAPTSTNEPEQLLTVKINSGTLHVSRRYGRTQSYVVKNSGAKAKQVLIEYPLDTNWTLLEPAMPAEKTRSAYRFLVAAEPGKPATLTIREERVVGEAVALTNLGDGQIEFYLASKAVSDKVKAGLAGVIQRKRAIAAVAARRRELDRQIEVIFAEQNRIRQNMAQLPRDGDLYNRYVKKLNEQEDQVEALRGQVQAAIAEEQKLQQELNAYLTSLDLS